MKFQETPLSGLVVIEPEVYNDDRGWFYESFNAEKFTDLGLPVDFTQDNHSFSTKGVLRGLHYQRAPKPMGKLVRCTRGKLWDAAVDLRADSPTYKQWFGLELSEENRKMLYIPVGFGHGFYALSDCELVYKCTNTFMKEADDGVAWNDPEIGVEWPLDGEPTLSEKDQNLPKLQDARLEF